MKKLNLSLITLSVLLNACSPEKPATPPRDSIRIALGATPATLDPTLIQDLEANGVIDNLFAGLVDFNNSNQPIPGLAEKWDVSADGKTYRFVLRQNLKFSDGTPLTAQDVLNTFYRLADPRNGAGYAYLLKNLVNGEDVVAGKLALNQLGISAPDANTIVMHLTHKNSSWLDILTLPCFDVIKFSTISTYGAAWVKPEHIVTSGAYTLVNYVMNGEMKLVKNKYYYAESQVAIKNVLLQTEANRTSEFNAYRSGALDMTSSVPMDIDPSLKQKYQAEFKRGQYEALVFYDFNNAAAPLKDNLKLRQALTIAIDREMLVNNIINDELRSPLYSTVTATIDNGAYQDIAYSWQKLPRAEQIKLAQQLYREAGYSPKHPLEINLLYNSDEGNKKRSLALAAMWQQVLGVKTIVSNQEWKTFLVSRHKGDFQIARDGANVDYNSVAAYAQMYMCKSPQNNSQYCNPAYDKLVNQAELSSTFAQKIALYKQALSVALNDYPILPLYQPTYTKLVKPYVLGYNPESNHLARFQIKWFSLKP